MKIYDDLIEYSKKNIYAMHMPGHKRNSIYNMPNPYSIDVTEVDGLDNLHKPEQMIREFMDDMRDFYGSIETFPLVNGSTCGLMAAIASLASFGDYVIMSANCHRSVYDLVGLLGLNPIYIYPNIDKNSAIGTEIAPESLEKILKEHYENEKKEIKAVIITSPTYEGVVSDVEGIGQISHKYKIPLVVDQAHGAHLSFLEKAIDASTPSALSLGADIVVESLHKTLPSLTQTALLHVCHERIDLERIRKNLGIFESSSPSYVLLASIAKCFYELREGGRKPWLAYEKRLDEFYEKTGALKNLKLWQYEKKEKSKLIILAENGPDLGKKLREKYKIETEMAASNYLLAMTSICDTDEGFERLFKALSELDEEIENQKEIDSKKEKDKKNDIENIFLYKNKSIPYLLSPYQIRNKNKTYVELEESEGKIAGENVYFYPPGIPFLVEGEKIDSRIIDYIKKGIEKGMNIVGLLEEENKIRLKIVDEKKNN